MSKQLILHMGFHKTGTTSIQKACRLNAERLVAAGIHYPSFDSGDIEYSRNHSVPIYSLFCEKPEDFRQNVLADYDVDAANRRYRRQLEQALQCEEGRLVISGEGISLLRPGELTALGQFVNDAGWAIRPVVYLRRPAGFLASWFAQRSRMHEPDTRWSVAQEIIERVTAIMSVFPDVEFYSFEQVCDQYGGPVQHFFSLLGLAEDAAVTARQLNQSASTQAVRLMQRINAAYPSIVRGKKNPQRSRADTSPLVRISGEKFRFSQGELDMVAPQIDALNTWLRDNLGAQFCDAGGHPEPGECVWSDQQLDDLADVLPDIPVHFIPPIQDYLQEEAGLTEQQLARLEHMIERDRESRACRELLAGHTKTLRRLARALKPHDLPRARSLLELASLGNPRAGAISDRLDAFERRLASGKSDSAQGGRRMYREIVGEHAETLRELAAELEPHVPELAQDLAELAELGRQRGGTVRNLITLLTNRPGSDKARA